jgi:glycosyltransferase involved in cell wall biosynthesis
MYVVYAPNVRTGGGLVLLQALLKGWTGRPECRAVLDRRAQSTLSVPIGIAVDWTRPGLLGRLRAEWQLKTTMPTIEGILCFHGLPPLLVGKCAKSRTTVFMQNRFVVEQRSPRSYPLFLRMRILLERALFHCRINSVSNIIVQTQSMKRAVLIALRHRKNNPQIHVRPFAPVSPVARSPVSRRRYDFVYPATGEPHKNHQRLLEAWEQLALEDIKPSLAITLGARDQQLWKRLQARADRTGLDLTNLGLVMHSEMAEVYGQAGALIFPSVGESFGLPLAEARSSNLPILASERDFVRDVCDPVESFDPDSAISIARAVKRFMRAKEGRVAIETPEAFWVGLTADRCRL